MNVYKALITRELLEHRGAFVYAPAILLLALFLMLGTALTFGDLEIGATEAQFVTAAGGSAVAQIGLAGIFAAWSAYLLVALFFYYADSFSADRRNNSLLFWKSLPQSDLKVLASKALAGITIFPLLIIGYALITGLLAYLLSFIVAIRVEGLPSIGFFDLVGNWIQMGIAGTVFFALTLLWYAPLLAMVAGLSTVVQRWSIPLAFLIPGAVVLVEYLANLGRPFETLPISNYIGYRLDGTLQDLGILQKAFSTNGLSAWELIAEMLTKTDWLQTLVGLIATAAVVYLASEYRRRRLEA